VHHWARKGIAGRAVICDVAVEIANSTVYGLAGAGRISHPRWLSVVDL
jgi:hypothetical protein